MSNVIQYINFNTIFHPITANMFAETFKAIHDSDQAVIPIQINSPGGYVMALQTILDIVDTSEKPVATFVTGLAASCAAALACSGTHGLRFIAPNAIFMIHQASGGPRGKTAEVEAGAKLLSEMTDRFVYARCDKAACKPEGFTQNLIKDNFNADLSYWAEEAIELGFFNEIGTIYNIKNIKKLLDKVIRV